MSPVDVARQADRAFDALYLAHRDRVYQLALRYSHRDRAWAEDVTQDVFIKVLQNLGELRDHDDLGGWLYRVTVNACLSRLRRERSLLHRALRAFQSAPSRESAPDHGEALALQEEARAALEALDRLPPQERVVLSMKLCDGKSQQEICEALGLSKGYVSKLVARAWERLRAAGWEVHDEAA